MSENSTRTAEAIIGPIAPDDYVLQPEVHAVKLPEEAGALSRILRSEPVAAIIKQYREADRAAIKYQSRYKFFARTAIALQCLGGLIGALFIAPQFFDIDNLNSAFGLNQVQLVLIVCATISGGVVSATSTFKRWNEARARAEMARIEFFTAVVSATDTERKDGEFALLPLQWEYFRRYQLQIQLSYYKKRGAKHQETALLHQYLARALALIVAALLINSISHAAGYGIIDVPTPLSLLVGVSIATMSSAISNWSLLNQDDNNAIRYAATSAKLEEINAQYLQAAQNGAQGGDRAGVLSLVNYINGFISQEHRQWIFLHEVAKQPDLGVLAKLPVLNLTPAPKK